MKLFLGAVGAYIVAAILVAAFGSPEWALTALGFALVALIFYAGVLLTRACIARAHAFLARRRLMSAIRRADESGLLSGWPDTMTDDEAHKLRDLTDLKHWR